MIELIGTLNKAISEDNIWMVFAIVLVFLLFKVKTVVDFWDDRRKAKITKIKEALECGTISGVTREHLENELEKEYWRLATGIQCEKEYREAIVKAHKNCNGEIGFRHFIRSQDELLFKDGVLSIKFNFLSRLWGVVALIGGLFLYLSGFFYMISAFLLYTDDIGKLLKYFVTGILLIPFSFWVGMGFAKFLSNKYVHNELAKQSAN